MNAAETQLSPRGKWLVVALVLIGLVATIIAAAYWRGVGDRTREAAESSRTFDLEAARERLGSLEQAFAARREDNPQSVLEPALEFVADYPGFSGAHRLLGQVYIELGESRKALAALERSIEINPNQANVHQLAGQVALMIDDLDTAARHYKKAVSLDPRNGNYRLHVAHVHLTRNEFEQARKELLQALALDSSLHQAHSALSDLYARENKLSLALQQAQKAIDLVPTEKRKPLITYTRKKASLLRRDNQPAAALRALQTLRASEQIQPDVLEEIATCFGQMNQPDKAASLYEEALIVMPLEPRLIAGAAEWHIRAGNLDAAREHIRTLESTNSNHPAIDHLRGRIEATNHEDTKDVTK